ncbi:hypothetical protein PINS_up013833 [Pythium insidiosum]|nr:hypothetical protein PINS_up013833 [Pythium insidiosum]
MVQRFAARYNVAEAPTLVKRILEEGATTATIEAIEVDDQEMPWISTPGGAAEAEVLELLRVIGESFPLGRVVCVEGFVYEGPGHYVSSVYGCGSPSRFESAFVGVYAPKISLFQQNKAWLTSDRLSVFGFHLLMRENCISLFHVVEAQRDGSLTLTLTHRTRINFSSSGPLYVLVIAIDLFVVTVNLLSTTELMATIPWIPHDHSALVTSSDYVDVLTRRMLRSTPFTVLTFVSQLVSWTVVLVNSVIWTWTETRYGRVRAFLSTIRFWVLVLVALNTMWNVFVFLTERHAYIFVKRAYVSMFEVLVVATAVAFAYRDSLFAISDVKQALEGQRVTDTEAFDGKIAFANTYPEGLEDTLMTPVAVAWTVYQPLVEIVAWSFAGAAVIAISRYLRRMATVCRRSSLQRVVAMPNVAVAPTTALAWGHSGGIERIVPGPQSSDVVTPISLPSRRYRRLPIEELLGVPLRARSLIRNWVAMDIEVREDERSHRVLQSATLVDHGLLLVDGSRLRGRRGFFGAIPTWATRSEFADPIDTARRLPVLH